MEAKRLTEAQREMLARFAAGGELRLGAHAGHVVESLVDLRLVQWGIGAGSAVVYWLTDTGRAVVSSSPCAACGNPSRGDYSIHRDGLFMGPEVPLCDACGGSETPTCEDLWRSIAGRLALTAATNGGE